MCRPRTAQTVCGLMAKLTVDQNQQDEIVCDPCCGTGRMLLAYADEKRPKELVGQDVDLRCVRITAINLGLRNLYGFVLWGNSLALECKLAYRTGLNPYGGVIRYARLNELAEKLGDGGPADASIDGPTRPTKVVLPPGRPSGSEKQLRLF